MRQGPAKAPPVVLDIALAAPAVLWLAVAAAVLVAVLAGFRALAAPADLTLPEAAALRDQAEVLRLIGRGADPNAAASIRRGMLRGNEVRMTPLEAAVEARHLEVVQLLVRHGADVDAANVPVLLCLARSVRAAEIVAFLERQQPSHGPPRCEDVRLP